MVQESCCQIRWRLYFEEEQWEVTDKAVFTNLNRGLTGFHSLLGYLSPGNQGWSAISPARISNKVVTTSECNNALWNLTPGGNKQHFLNLIFMKCSKNYFVGTALVFMNLAAVEDFCSVLFFTTFRLLITGWGVNTARLKCESLLFQPGQKCRNRKKMFLFCNLGKI